MHATAQRTSFATLARAMVAVGLACTLMLAAAAVRSAECFPNALERADEPVGLIAH
ncbi:hypothetical protein DSM104440_01935 [Usitatibacter palustris]|uniref:Uncharacterized protein n=1 Tax=Usitatibacter palustris TaxID=2732487 RepID=A0A6M4H8G9_9PROT|nr:hypothetical protein DSM104440_01935 [Usitatibacter palustris]